MTQVSGMHTLAEKILYRKIKLDLTNVRGEVKVYQLYVSLASKRHRAKFIRSLTIARHPEEQDLRKSIVVGGHGALPFESDLYGRGSSSKSIRRHHFRYILDDPYFAETVAVPQILAYAESLKTFDLRGTTRVSPRASAVGLVEWDCFHPTFQRALMDMLERKSVHTKIIIGINGIPAQAMQTLRARKHFQIVHCGIDTNTTEETQAAPNLANLPLSMNSISILGMLRQSKMSILSLVTGREISTLTYEINFREEFTHLQNVLGLACIQRSLTELTIITFYIFGKNVNSGRCMPIGWTWEANGRLDLTQLQLQVLVLNFKTWNRRKHGGIEGYDEWRWALEILRSLADRRRKSTDRDLRIIELNVGWNNQFCPEALWEPEQWKEWDHVLARHVKNGMEQIRISITGGPRISPDYSVESSGHKIRMSMVESFPSVGLGQLTVDYITKDF
ncbi:hypothetical protein FA15DRAFT_706157 [Coprinopsis marcescibilis]|uniref:Uncharacterized protein n=1 Tax=Coprinopsis marcescibilis TaxID=230819 RepID=A0A5C3KQZ5_COPMA|nr:hypothetical protein FA15DRAFT_706157 [Coprinopsis marcescibilis]